MTWNDAMKAAALAAEAERKTKVAPGAADTAWRWNPNDVWLSRVRQLRDRAPQPSLQEPAIQPRQGTTPRT